MTTKVETNGDRNSAMTNGGRTLLSADYKAPGGKLLRVRLRETGGRIESAKISGEFFLIPEDSLANLEKMLEDVTFREKELKLLMDRFFAASSAQGLGETTDDYVTAILAATPAGRGSGSSARRAETLPRSRRRSARSRSKRGVSTNQRYSSRREEGLRCRRKRQMGKRLPSWLHPGGF